MDGNDLVESPARKTFRTHANYLHAFATIVRGGMPVTPAAALIRTAERMDRLLPRKPPLREVHEGELRGCLTRAWGTELLLATGRRVASEDELLRLTNSWGVVQAYYAAYSATQALIVAEGRARPTAHTSTQKQAVDLWVTRAFAVAPWSFAMGSCAERNTGDDGSVNGPGRPIRAAHPWSNCDPESCWDIAALALRSTRDEAVEQALAGRRKEKLSRRRKAWEEAERGRIAKGRRPRVKPPWPASANLTAGESADVESRVRPYTVLDYLYRLRIKANYEDATVFVEGPEDDSSSIRVAQDLELVTAATLLAHELRIGRLIGRDAVLAIVDGWLETSGVLGNTVALAARRELLFARL
jgi:hypothetical protein